MLLFYCCSSGAVFTFASSSYYCLLVSVCQVDLSAHAVDSSGVGLVMGVCTELWKLVVLG